MRNLALRTCLLPLREKLAEGNRVQLGICLRKLEVDHARLGTGCMVVAGVCDPGTRAWGPDRPPIWSAGACSRMGRVSSAAASRRTPHSHPRGTGLTEAGYKSVRFQRHLKAKPAVLALLAVLLLIGLATPCQAQEKAAAATTTLVEPADAMRTVQQVVLFGLVSLAPVALLMITPFVRINIVLVLLRQALGSPQVPGNQVLMALSLLLSALVMRPVGERVYHDAVEPYMAGKAGPAAAWDAGAKPIKTFMVEQIVRTNHQDYLWSLYQHTAESKAGLAEPEDPDQFPLGVVAPAFILSELTTALMIGFYLYLPFLIIDLVVSSVLAAMGLFMLPPTLVAMPVKLIVFVLIDGWLLVADMLLSGFSVSGA